MRRQDIKINKLGNVVIRHNTTQLIERIAQWFALPVSSYDVTKRELVFEKKFKDFCSFSCICFQKFPLLLLHTTLILSTFHLLNNTDREH